MSTYRATRAPGPVEVKCWQCGRMYAYTFKSRDCKWCADGGRRAAKKARRTARVAARLRGEATATTRAERFDSVVPTSRLCRICDMNPRAHGVCRECLRDDARVAQIREAWSVEYERRKALTEAFA